MSRLEGMILNSQTQKNRLKTMCVEEFAFEKYAPFAEQALQPRVEHLADRENGEGGEQPVHLAKMTELAGLVGNDDDAVCNSTLGKLYEVDRKYRGLATINQDETDHRGTGGEIA
jgi:hypothetical protein